jgi:GTP-binding protein
MVTLQAVRPMSLEDCLEYIGEGELVEVTPENVRMRKPNGYRIR